MENYNYISKYILHRVHTIESGEIELFVKKNAYQDSHESSIYKVKYVSPRAISLQLPFALSKSVANIVFA